jgi:hypothetical protein
MLQKYGFPLLSLGLRPGQGCEVIKLAFMRRGLLITELKNKGPHA